MPRVPLRRMPLAALTASTEPKVSRVDVVVVATVVVWVTDTTVVTDVVWVMVSVSKTVVVWVLVVVLVKVYGCPWAELGVKAVALCTLKDESSSSSSSSSLWSSSSVVLDVLGASVVPVFSVVGPEFASVVGGAVAGATVVAGATPQSPAELGVGAGQVDAHIDQRSIQQRSAKLQDFLRFGHAAEDFPFWTDQLGGIHFTGKDWKNQPTQRCTNVWAWADAIRGIVSNHFQNGIPRAGLWCWRRSQGQPCQSQPRP